MNLLDTIAAISTPFGKGGIAVIRISGSDAFSVADKIFKPMKNKSLLEATPKMSYYGRIFLGDVQIDDGLAVCFKAPNSFTGEDTVEISCHGGILVTQRVLTAALNAGARAAEAGEFTRRAFINGKMKLSSAEALGSLLEAQTDEQISLARSGMRGTLSEKTDIIYNSLCTVLASVFAHIDYPDEDLADMSEAQMIAAVDENIQRLEALSATYKTGRAIAEGIPTVIAGRTNAGKSSLYNAIVGREAAIVTSIEGTTRDILTETATLGRVMIRLSDTAGLRETDDVVEKIGVERAKDELSRAELVLAVLDGSSAPSDEDIEFVNYLKNQDFTTIFILNKSDLGVHPEAKTIAESFAYNLTMSAKSLEGFDNLVSLVESVFIDNSLDTGRDAVIANSRQHSAVCRSLELLKGAKQYIGDGLPLEVCASELEGAMVALGELDGRTVAEDIVSKIFANFCVGK